MELRDYVSEDSKVICSWVKDEKMLYQWSANRIGHFPLDGEELNVFYTPALAGGDFYPLCGVDDNGNLEGHLFIRYPNPEDKTTVGFGFVIVNPALRGQGKGKELLNQAFSYAKEVLHAKKCTLGVFANNANARHCYTAVGFVPNGNVSVRELPLGDWECIELEKTRLEN